MCSVTRVSVLAEAVAVLQRRAARLDARSPERPYHLLYALHAKVRPSQQQSCKKLVHLASLRQGL